MSYKENGHKPVTPDLDDPEGYTLPTDSSDDRKAIDEMDRRALDRAKAYGDILDRHLRILETSKNFGELPDASTVEGNTEKLTKLYNTVYEAMNAILEVIDPEPEEADTEAPADEPSSTPSENGNESHLTQEHSGEQYINLSLAQSLTVNGTARAVEELNTGLSQPISSNGEGRGTHQPQHSVGINQPM